jgi:hypothetical protein
MKLALITLSDQGARVITRLAGAACDSKQLGPPGYRSCSARLVKIHSTACLALAGLWDHRGPGNA